MGIFDSIGNIVRGQLIDVIEWTDSTNNTIVHKYDMNGKEIMMGAQLTVRAKWRFSSTKASWRTCSSPAAMSCPPPICR